MLDAFLTPASEQFPLVRHIRKTLAQHVLASQYSLDNGHTDISYNLNRASDEIISRILSCRRDSSRATSRSVDANKLTARTTTSPSHVTSERIDLRLELAIPANSSLPASPYIRAATSDEIVSAKRRVREAVHIIDACSPRISDWVGIGLYAIVGAWTEGDLDFSQSEPQHLGRAVISLNADARNIAEMLVHEASHQHFFTLQRLACLNTGRGETVYSPITRSERPVSKALLGYHAAANILNFYDNIPIAMVAPDTRRRRDFIHDMCVEFSSGLSKATSLTRDGRDGVDVLNTLCDL